MRATTAVESQQAPPDAREIREQARQTIRDAQEAARDAQAAARDAEAQVRAQGGDIRIVVPPVPPLPPFPDRGGGFAIQGDPFNHNVIPPQAVDIAMGFFIMCAVIVIGWPLARAFGRRLERKDTVPAEINPAVTEQLQRIEQAVEAMSIEVERISESQRFMARLQHESAADRPALPTERR